MHLKIKCWGLTHFIFRICSIFYFLRGSSFFHSLEARQRRVICGNLHIAVKKTWWSSIAMLEGRPGRKNSSVLENGLPAILQNCSKLVDFPGKKVTPEGQFLWDMVKKSESPVDTRWSTSHYKVVPPQLCLLGYNPHEYYTYNLLINPNVK